CSNIRHGCRSPRTVFAHDTPGLAQGDTGPNRAGPGGNGPSEGRAKPLAAVGAVVRADGTHAARRRGLPARHLTRGGERWPGIPITLWQGARVIEDSRRLRWCRVNKSTTFREVKKAPASPGLQDVLSIG